MERLLSPTEFLAYITVTNYLAVAGGILLWTALFVLGLIARRLERAFDTPTYWRFLLWSPSGIVLYTVYTIVSGGSAPGKLFVYTVERYVAYGLLSVSAIGCVLGCGTTLWALLRVARTSPGVAT